ncbi:MAG: FAD-dependent oxidoreductase [Xanthomonadaceae bacterium]|nr:FAD-dependent oxidoreductase [Xanthomonadaceae bacterium]MDZ4115093.1 FAD-dependent oxidoreductase [Xanthomonadaceae bacterium]MDZ4378063.1 FAD-dependent oxidoreductase [Xanthomonadaceae bacterium]
MNEPPIVIIGAGIAGLCTALAAAPRKVLVLSRGSAGNDGATPLAQGGIAAALGADDSPAQHAHDTVIAGAGCNDLEAVAVLTTQAAEAIVWLQQQGVAFDRDGDQLSLHLEGGHSHARIAHAGGDRSGQRIAHALAAAVAKHAAHVTLQSGCDVDALLLREGRVVGVRTRDHNGQSQQIMAAAVVLATGGIGALFACTSNPPSANGAGLALGLRAGAAGRDLEFIQFHPTALAPNDGALPAQLPLISEAIRGAGARLCDGDGRALMAAIDVRGDLAPRDIVARRVWQARHAGASTWLDARSIGERWPERFPTVFAACQAQAIDPRREPIPVLPAAHFHMGGLATDLLGRTRVPGLFAVGEVACNGVHGSNRLASNSLLEGVVFGRRLGAWLADDIATPAATGALQTLALGPPLDVANWQRLRQLLWQHLGPVRSASGLDTALATITNNPSLAASWPGELARALLNAARQRAYSIGAHYRSDDALGTHSPKVRCCSPSG